MTPQFLALLEQVRGLAARSPCRSHRVRSVQSKATKALHLSGLGLERVPARVWECTWLHRLDLGHNDITELPADIGNLINLQELWLNGAKAGLRHRSRGFGSC